MMEKMYLMYKNLCLQEIDYDRQTKYVHIKHINIVRLWSPFQQRQPSWDEFVHFLEIEHCFPRNRGNVSELLQKLGLKRYDPLDIVRKLNGAMAHSYRWVLFPGDTVTWDDIARRVM